MQGSDQSLHSYGTQQLNTPNAAKPTALPLSNQGRRRFLLAESMPFTLDTLEAFVSSAHYDSATAGLIASRIPTLKAAGAPGEHIAPGITRIHGNLCNVHGKYGPCDKALSGKKPKKGRAPAKARQTPAQRAQAKQQQQEQNRKAVFSQLGLYEDATAALTSLRDGKPVEDDGGLVKMGLAEQASDGSYRLTPTGRAFMAAANAGDAGRARDTLSRGGDAQGKRTQQQNERAQRQQAKRPAARRQTAAERLARGSTDGKKPSAIEQLGGGTAGRTAEGKRPAKASSGGSKKKPEQQAAEKPLKVEPTKRVARSRAPSVGGVAGASGNKGPAKEPKPEKAPAKQIAPALQEAVQSLSDGEGLTKDGALALIRNGLATVNKDGMLVLTAAGMRATTKAQTDQEKAMFASMGGGGKGGGGGGGGAGGSKLWPKGPSGKRTPQAAAAQSRGRAGVVGEGKARPADPGKPAHGQTVGNVTKAYGNNPNESYTMRHELVDMGDIQASNTANGGINPHYDASLQPRDRSRASSQAQIADVAQNMNPEVMTTDFHRIDAGTPIIDKSGNVLSGNGRTLALQRAAELHPDKYNAYKDEIKAKAREAGIDPAAVDKMKNPVMVRRLEGDHDAAAFAREANSSGTLRMSPLEQAKVDASMISDRHMLKLNAHETGDIDRALRDKSNKPFVDEFLASVPDNERANLLTRHGELNQMGLYRAKAAIYTRAFPGEAGHRMAESMLESLDPDIKTVQNGINGALPAFSRATSLARSGLRDPSLDLSHDFAKTIDVYARVKDNTALTHNTPANQVIAKYLGQSSMFDRELNRDQERLLVHIDKIARKPTEVRGFMERYARLVEQAPQPGQHNLFGEGHAMTRAQLLDALLGDAATSMPDTQAGMF